MTIRELFSVTQFFEDGTYETVRKYVVSIEAAKAFKHYITSVGAQMGTTKRVIITDMLDCINVEWIHGKGIVFPEHIPNPFGESDKDEVKH